MPLLMFCRLAPPTAGFTIMNQLSMENLTEPLTHSHEFQNQSPFLLYKNAKSMFFIKMLIISYGLMIVYIRL